MLFADNTVLIYEIKVGVNRMLKLWRKTLKSKGLRLSRTKIEYMICDFSGIGCEDKEVNLKGQIVYRRDTF
jgi:hypothetical protein